MLGLYGLSGSGCGGMVRVQVEGGMSRHDAVFLMQSTGVEALKFEPLLRRSLGLHMIIAVSVSLATLFDFITISKTPPVRCIVGLTERESTFKL